MRTVSEIKKFSALKNLHSSLIPKWSSTTDTSSVETACDNPMSSLSTNIDNPTSCIESCDRLQNGSSAIKTETDCDDLRSEKTYKMEPSETNNWNNVTNETDTKLDNDNEKNDMKTVQMEENTIVAPKMVYFFERGDSLKKEIGNEREINEANETDSKGDFNNCIGDLEEKPVIPKMVYFFERGDFLKKDVEEVEDNQYDFKEYRTEHHSILTESLPVHQHGVKRQQNSKVI